MADTIEDICKKLISSADMRAGCNIFVQSAAAMFAQSFGKDAGKTAMAVAGNADAIAVRVKNRTAPFVAIANKDLATAHATAGKFVIAALTKEELTYIGKDAKPRIASMGHIAVVVPGGPSKPIKVILMDGTPQDCRGGYPYCYQGAAIARFRFTSRTQVDAVFPSVVLGKVHYAYLDC